MGLAPQKKNDTQNNVNLPAPPNQKELSEEDEAAVRDVIPFYFSDDEADRFVETVRGATEAETPEDLDAVQTFAESSFGAEQGLLRVEGISNMAEAFQGMMDVPEIDYREDARGYASQQARRNILGVAAISGMAEDIAELTGANLQDVVNDQFYEGMEALLGDLEDVPNTSAGVLKQSKAISEAMLSGDINQETAAYMTLVGAELGIDTSDLDPRDLGMNSLQMQQLGAEIATKEVIPGSEALAQSVMALTPDQVDRSKLYLDNLSQMAEAGLVDPNDVLVAATRVAAENAELAWASTISEINMATSIYGAEINALLGLDQHNWYQAQQGSGINFGLNLGPVGISTEL